MKRLLVLFFIAIFVQLHGTALSPWAEGKGLEEVLNEMEKANKKFESLEADIVYTRTLFLLDEEETSKGEVKYKKPRRLYLKFDPPRDELNVADGKFLWVYRPAQKQVEKYELQEATASTQELNFFEFGYEAVEHAKENYNISIVDTKEEGGKRFYVLQLLPKDPKGGFRYSEMRFWVAEEEWLPVKMDLYENAGEIINHIELKSVKQNRKIKDDMFSFTPPKEAEVIEP